VRAAAAACRNPSLPHPAVNLTPDPETRRVHRRVRERSARVCCGASGARAHRRVAHETSGSSNLLRHRGYRRRHASSPPRRRPRSAPRCSRMTSADTPACVIAARLAGACTPSPGPVPRPVHPPPLTASTATAAPPATSSVTGQPARALRSRAPALAFDTGARESGRSGALDVLRRLVESGEPL
jgi:hypothetical protein